MCSLLAGVRLAEPLLDDVVHADAHEDVLADEVLLQPGPPRRVLGWSQTSVTDLGVATALIWADECIQGFFQTET